MAAAGVVCNVCAFLGAHEAYRYYDKAYLLGKSTYKVINQVAEYV